MPSIKTHFVLEASFYYKNCRILHAAYCDKSKKWCLHHTPHYVYDQLLHGECK